MFTAKTRLMNFVRSNALLVALIACAAFSRPASAESPAVRNCTWCHGASAQGYTPAPRLAGQRRVYLEQQISNFKAHTRDNPASKQFMWGAAAYVSVQTARDLAAYFASLTPKAASDGRNDLVATGRSIYQTGRPEANIAACVACHGPNAEGTGSIPRLGGLAYAYLKTRLEEWGAGYHASARYPMPRIARKLSPEQIDALASYLSFVGSVASRQQ